MEQNEIDEILDHINTKIAEDVPSLVKMLVRKRIGSFQSFEAESLPDSLRNCSVEQLTRSEIIHFSHRNSLSKLSN